MIFEMFLRTPSMRHWKLAGHQRSPMGDVIHWYWPWPGIVKAVSSWYFSSIFSCQKPDVRSKKEKMVVLALLMSPMHSVISFMEYLSMWEWLLSYLKSWTTRNPCPCFFGTQKIGELYSEFEHLTTPSLGHSSSDCSIKFWWASGILNCFQYTGLLSLRWILCLKFVAKPRSYLLTVMALWCLYRMSIYFFLIFFGHI